MAHNTQTSGPKFIVDIEGTEYPWESDSITVAELRRLGNLPSDQPVIEIDLKDNTQRTLSEGETVQLRPGLGFSKKIKYQRGFRGSAH